MATEERDEPASWVISIAALAFHAANGLFALVMGVFPANLDELQHLSFIRAMEAAPSLLPRYENLRVLDPHGQAFTSTANYLNHPSLYYLMMGAVDRAVGGDVTVLRLCDLGLSLAAVAMMLAAGFGVLQGWKARAVFAAVLVLFPKLGVFAGLINNDNAALLAVAVAFAGLVEWQQRPTMRGAALLGLGLALCGWTKLTTLLMMGFGVLIAECLRLRDRPQPRPVLAAYAIVAAGMAVAAIPSLANLAAYGRLLHHPSAYYVPPDQRVALSFAGYGMIFLGNMATKWSALEPSGALQQLGLYLTLGLAAAAVVVGLRRRPADDGEPESGAAWRVACGLILATAPVLVIHLYFGWRTFIEDGYLEMAQARYYYGVWPGFALGLALLWRWAPAGMARTLTMVAATALLASSSMAALGLRLVAHGALRIG